jgi:Transcriptional regulatory protein, C terminal
VQTGTRTLGRAEADAGGRPGGESRDGQPRGGEPDGGKRAGGEHNGGEHNGDQHGGAEPVGEQAAVRRPGADGTLLAVVPIPGTGTSLAIVGYPVTAQGSAIAAGSTSAGSISAGPISAGTAGMGPIPEALTRDGPVFDGSVFDSPVFDGPVFDSTALDDPPLAGAAAAGRRPGLQLDQDQRRLWVDGSEVTLTFQEFELLAFLAAHPTTVFSRADLVREVWQRDFAADSRTVDVHVSRLRRKLGPSYGRCLVTEYRVGYQFRPLA